MDDPTRVVYLCVAGSRHIGSTVDEVRATLEGAKQWLADKKKEVQKRLDESPKDNPFWSSIKIEDYDDGLSFSDGSEYCKIIEKEVIT